MRLFLLVLDSPAALRVFCASRTATALPPVMENGDVKRNEF